MSFLVATIADTLHSSLGIGEDSLALDISLLGLFEGCWLVEEQVVLGCWEVDLLGPTVVFL